MYYFKLNTYPFSVGDVYSITLNSAEKSKIQRGEYPTFDKKVLNDDNERICIESLEDIVSPTTWKISETIPDPTKKSLLVFRLLPQTITVEETTNTKIQTSTIITTNKRSSDWSI